MHSRSIALLLCVFLLTPSLCPAETPADGDAAEEFFRSLLCDDMFYGTDDYFGEYRDIKFVDGIGDPDNRLDDIGDSGGGDCPT